MGTRKILVTSNNTLVTTDAGGGICRTMVLTWISEALKGKRMNDMASVLTGSGVAMISARHKALKVRIGHSRNLQGGDEAGTVKDFSASFDLKASGQTVPLPTALVGMTLDPAGLSADTCYVMITLRGQAGAHAIGMAINVSGKHYFLDPNSGLYECDKLTEIAGPLGLLALHLGNYFAGYPNAFIEEFEGLS